MFQGIGYLVGACLIWGLIFVIPQFLADFSSIEIVLGRYISFGILSLLLFFRKGFSQLFKYPFHVWRRACIFSIFSNILYYLGIVIGLRYASSAITVLMLALAPVVITLYGNWQGREISYKSLIVPCLAIACGVVFVNITTIDFTVNTTISSYLFGILGIVIALFGWSWFAVKNAHFLKTYPISAAEWSSIMGVATLILSLGVGGIFYCIGEEIDLSRFAAFSEPTVRFLIASLILGLLCSWLASALWNRAAHLLPVSFAGTLLILEPIFGLIFVYLLQKRLPNLMELLGMCFMFMGILAATLVFRKKQIQTH